jgi:glycosyltransferase involved in cell wall biosynthesis
VNSPRPKLAFVTPLFLFPTDAGGKIRTNNILRGLKNGRFDVTLISPATEDQRRRWEPQIIEACDRFIGWEQQVAPAPWRRALGLLSALPINVLSDRSAVATRVIEQALSDIEYDLVVFDFVHAAVLRPRGLSTRTLCFTHNVEAEIFARHATKASSALMRAVWRSQHRKMIRFEARVLRDFTSVVAVSARDADYFREHYRLPRIAVIPTGVDLEFFEFRDVTERPSRKQEGQPPTVIFTGVMDWIANVDGVQFFVTQVWPRILAAIPEARFMVVGRNPSKALIESMRAVPGVTVTGFVDDVRPYVHAADAFVIPLRVGGGTRIKAFEAIAMGCPVVATTIGIEGLDLVAGEHYLLADDPAEMADAVIRVLKDAEFGAGLSRRARTEVESKFGHDVAARAFEQACIDALSDEPASAMHERLAHER